MVTENKEKLLGSREAAKYLAISFWTLREWRRSGKVKAYRVGGRKCVFLISDLEKLITKA